MRINARPPSATAKIILFLAGLATICAISLMRSLTGPEYALSLFYLAPILLITWYVGLRTGISMAVLSATAWLIADLSIIETFHNPYVPYINEALRLLVFIGAITLLSMLRQKLAAAGTDFLTGVANSRRFYEILDAEIARVRRYGQPFTLVFLDLDNFKMVNDNYGHQAGDKMLQAVAAALVSETRDTDTVARFGGDEFIILMPEADEKAAWTTMDRLQEHLTVVIDKKEVTFSAGMACYSVAPRSAREAVGLADTLMYQAKAAGKNTIMQELVGKA